jgi:hypothetical protein
VAQAMAKQPTRRPPDAASFGHQLLALREALGTPSWTSAAPVGVASGREDQPTDRQRQQILGFGSWDRLSTSAGRLPSADPAASLVLRRP